MPLITRERNLVLWLGKACPSVFEAACQQRDLVVQPTSIKIPAKLWAQARGIVFHEPDAHLQSAMQERLVADALMQGLYFRTLAVPADVPPLNDLLRNLGLRQRLSAWDVSGLVRTAEDIARHDPQRGPGTVELRGCGKCRGEDRVLLRRAFADCSEVEFRDLTGDHRKIFQAFGRLKTSLTGPYPLPFLVKLEDHKRAAKEMAGYAQATTHFIPFQARPNLDTSRCLMGARRGLIVANFIENAEPLQTLVQRGTAQTALNSLFEDALRGWRTQAYWNPQQPTGSLSPEGVIASFSSKHRSRAESRASEAKALGGALAACEVAKLLDGLPPIPHRTAFSHGDLHGDNVHVRMGQAILIDFLNVGTKPIVHDPAALETALALNFGGELQVWRDVMANLYSLENPTALPPLSPPLTPLTHMWNAVRQVRRFGLADEISPCEYARAVAVHLLRHALRKPRANATAERRATMVLLAEKLAKELGAIDNAVKTPRAA